MAPNFNILRRIVPHAFAAGLAAAAALVGTGGSAMEIGGSAQHAASLRLGVATHFAHGGMWRPDVLDTVGEAGAGLIRDGLGWKQSERSEGAYSFGNFRVAWPEAATAAGVESIATLMPGGNPLYGGGDTVTAPEDIAAFADFVLAVLDRFDGLHRIEIGNEFNTSNFVSGAAATSDMAARAEIYTRIVAAVSARVREAHPDVEIIGGALHSVPVGYVRHLAEAGAFQHVDSLAIHPYGLPPDALDEALQALNDALGELPAAMRPKIVATEFGRTVEEARLAENADYLAKMVAVMGDAGVTDAIWYALLDEDDVPHGNMGLYDTPGAPNPALAAFRFVSGLLDAAGAPERVETDGAVNVFDFGRDTFLVWGSAQDVRIEGRKLAFLDAAGNPVAAPERIGATAFFMRGEEISIETGAGRVLGDSYYQFDLQQSDGPWSQHAIKTQRVTESFVDLTLMGGQERYNESWNPYLGTPSWRPFLMNATTVVPVGFGDSGSNERAAVDRFTAADAMVVDVVGSWSVGSGSRDGIGLTVVADGLELYRATGLTGDVELLLRAIRLQPGSTLDFIVDDGGDSSGDATLRHIRVLAHDGSQSDGALIRAHLRDDIIESNDVRAGGLRGGAGDDLLRLDASGWVEGGAGDDRIFGSAGDDELAGGSGDDRLDGGGGRDLLTGGDGSDKLIGGAGDDRLAGGAGRDRLFGGAGADRLDGDDGADALDGGSGDDALAGGTGDDMLRGRDGADALDGGAGVDQLFGGAGADRFVFGPDGLGTADRIRDFSVAERDVIDLGALSAGHIVEPEVEVIRAHLWIGVRIDGTLYDLALAHGLAAQEGALDWLWSGGLVL